MNRFSEETGLGHEVRVEDRDEIPARTAEAVFEGSGFESGPIPAMDVVNVDAAVPVVPRTPFGHIRGVVGRVVKDLDLEPVAGIVQSAYGVDETFDDVQLVEHGELDRHLRKLGESLRGFRTPMLVSVVQIHHEVAVHPQDRQRDQDREIGGQEERIRGKHHDIVDCRLAEPK